MQVSGYVLVSITFSEERASDWVGPTASLHAEHERNIAALHRKGTLVVQPITIHFELFYLGIVSYVINIRVEQRCI
jgi:hypothetical protein